MSFDLQGVENIVAKIEAMADTRRLESVMGTACAMVERDAKTGAPKGIGELRRSITSKVESNNDAVKGTVYSPLEYAPYVEHGTGLFAEKGGRKDVPWHYKDDEGKWHSTSGQKPQPFMRPALNNNREDIVRLIKEGLGR